MAQKVYAIFVIDSTNELFGDSPKRLYYDVGLFLTPEAAKPFADTMRKMRNHINGKKSYSRVDVQPIYIQ